MAFSRSQSYKIQSGPKDNSFKQCISFLTLVALFFMIVTVLLCCYLRKVKNEEVENISNVTEGSIGYLPIEENATIQNITDSPWERKTWKYIDTANSRDTTSASYNNIYNSSITSYSPIENTEPPQTTERNLVDFLFKNRFFAESETISSSIISSSSSTTNDLSTAIPVLKKTDPTTPRKDPTTTSKMFLRTTATTKELVTTTDDTTTSKRTNPTDSTFDLKCENSTSLKNCNTYQCKNSASKMLFLMDHQTDPCDDFYNFACDGINSKNIELKTIDNKLLDIDWKELNLSKIHITQFKKYFDSCIKYNKDTTKDTVTKLLKSLHLEDSAHATSNGFTKLTNLVADVILFGPHWSTLKMAPVFDVIMEIAPDGTFIPVITAPTHPSPILDLTDGEYFDNICISETIIQSKSKISVKEIYKIYKNCLKEFVINHTDYEVLLTTAINSFNMFSHLPEFNQSQTVAKAVTDIIWDIVDTIGGLTEYDITKEKIEGTHIYYDLNELTINYPEILWEILFEKLFGDKRFDFKQIKIMFPKYLKKLFKFYKNKQYDEIKLHMISMIAHDLYMDYLQPSTSSAICDRTKYCTKVVSSVMDDVASEIYMEKIKKDVITYKVDIAEKIFKQSKQTYIAAIENATWLTTDEKGILLTKLNKLDTTTNAMQNYFTGNKLEQIYEKLPLGDCFITNTKYLQNLKRMRMYELNGKYANESDHIWTYIATPISTEPVLLNTINLLVIPFRYIDENIPNKDDEIQNYELYSKLSFRFSFEISTMFNPSNINKLLSAPNYDYTNYFETYLLDPAVIKIHNPHYIISFDNKDISFTKNSRFSDDSAIRNAFETYKIFNSKLNTDVALPWLNYDIKKLFYLSFAQNFCVKYKPSDRIRFALKLYGSDKLLNYYRLNSILINSDQFSEVFECPPGSTMSPDGNMGQFPDLITNLY